jgi:bisphosphoglycerate-dependent phosphoglycerate mutase
LWNEKNLFTGCVDVPLTPKGVDEAIEAGKRICNIPVDVIYTSSLIRAQMTAMLAMMQHRRKKVLKYFPFKFPVFICVCSYLQLINLRGYDICR